MAFAVATCTNSSGRFRLLWRIGGRRVRPSQRLQLACPACKNQFGITVSDLTVFDAGKEEFPATSILGLESLLWVARAGKLPPPEQYIERSNAARKLLKGHSA